MTPKYMEVRIAGVPLRVPTYGSEEATQMLADRITALLKELEESSTRVNTQAFALQVAYAFAKEAAELRDEVDAREEALVERMAKCQESIEQLRDEIDAST